MIAFSGTDGAGKSTQIAKLCDALTLRGRRPRVVWFRPGYSTEARALKQTWRRLRAGKATPPGPSAERSRLLEKPGVQRAWLAMALVDTWLQCALKMRVWRAAGQVVLCDRYIDDAIMDLQTLFPEVVADDWLPWRMVRSMCSRPTVQVLLVLSSEEAERRCELKEEPFPTSLEVRQFREANYERLSRDPAWVVVDASQSEEDVHLEILRAIDERASGSGFDLEGTS